MKQGCDGCNFSESMHGLLKHENDTFNPSEVTGF